MRTAKTLTLDFKIEPTPGETVRVEITTKATKALLGTIGWERNWYQYAFTPAPGARYTVGVLRAISRQLDICMRDWERSHAKSGHPKRPTKRQAKPVATDGSWTQP